MHKHIPSYIPQLWDPCPDIIMKKKKVTRYLKAKKLSPTYRNNTANIMSTIGLPFFQVLQPMLIHLTLTKIQQDKPYYFPYFVDDETEVQ